MRHLRGVRGLVVGAIIFSLAATASASAPEAYWVFFRDRGPAPPSAPDLAEAAQALSPRALARRAKALCERDGSTSGRSVVDERDLDPAAPYVAAVEGKGASIRTRSRWLNAVSVDAAPPAIAAIRALPFVRGVQPVAHGEPARSMSADEFSYGPAAHQLQMLGIPQAHAMGYRGEGVLICVLDSGFELEHEAFDQLVVRAERDFVFRDADTSYDPRQDLPNQATHGTTVLSVLAGYAPGRIVGPAYRAEFLLGKTEWIGSETRAEEDAWCAAVEWAETAGADLVSSSLSYPTLYRRHERDGRTPVITRAANLALERGLLIVNSTGNYGPGEVSLSPPSDSPAVISVGSVDRNGRISPFSSVGPTWDRRIKPDLVALGSGARVVTARTRDRYGFGSGTSYSAPLVAGCAAIVMSAHPDWGPEAVRDALLMSGDRASRPDHRYGWGVPNVRDAILYPALEGKVTDLHTGEPIGGARVEWEPASGLDSTRIAPGDSPARGSARSDSTGAYVIPNLPAGSFRLRVEAPGYFESVSEPLEVPPSLGDVNYALRYRGE